MAEGETPHEVADNPRPVMDSHLLDSPICLEQMHQPESLPCLHACPLSECRVKEVGKFSIKCPSDTIPCCAAGVVYLPDDHIVVGDFNNNKIKLYTASGQFEDELNVQGRPHDMCRVDDHTVAVANNDVPVISLIKVNSSKLVLLSEIMLSNGTCSNGITFTGGGFAASYGQTVYGIRYDGNTEYIRQDGNTEHVHTNPVPCYHLAYNPKTQHIYGSQFTSTNGAVAVYRLADGTRTDMAMVGVLYGALGVDVDDDGNVYVCGRSSNNVVQMSGDGTRVRELLTPLDGVATPRAISVCGNKFVVTNESSSDRNDVRVFSLY